MVKERRVKVNEKLMVPLVKVLHPRRCRARRRSVCELEFGAEPFRTFTASYPVLHPKAHLGSIALWALVFGCKATESYFFLTLSFRDPIAVMVGMKIQGCSDR
jgi:hypothetical protein